MNVGGAVNVLVNPILNSVKGFQQNRTSTWYAGSNRSLNYKQIMKEMVPDPDEVGKLIKNAGATKDEVDAPFKGEQV